MTFTSVCPGAMLLGRPVCSTVGERPPTGAPSTACAISFPGIRVEEKLHAVEDGPVLTSAGISAGIDMALRVVARDLGDAVGRATARHMEYAFPDDNRRRV
jgi:hypothetical protein